MKEEKDIVSVDKHTYIILEQINTEDDKLADNTVVKDVRNQRYDDEEKHGRCRDGVGS